MRISLPDCLSKRTNPLNTAMVSSDTCQNCKEILKKLKYMDKEEEVLPMIEGSGETSYAANSKNQEKAIWESKVLVEEAVKDVYSKTRTDSFVVVDLGCSSGPNTFLLLSMVINALADHCQKLSRQKPPEILCFLNDLPENDFNTLFQNLEFFQMKIEQEKKEDVVSIPNYYVMGAPGSFYGRLFPSNSVHFFHSSYCLHWISKVPDGVKYEEGVPSNEKNIHIATNSTPNIIQSYHEQFQSDFSKFLDLRFSELIAGGRMVLSFLGRKSLDARHGEMSCLFSLLADALDSMIHQGIVEKGKIKSFYIPNYTPSVEEAKEVIVKQGLFSIDQIYTMASNWDPNIDCFNEHKPIDYIASGKYVAKTVRAVYGPLLARQFGLIIMDELFSRFALNVANYLVKENGKFTTIILSLFK